MGFMANAPASFSLDEIENDGWFPDIPLTTLRDTTRLDGTVTDARLTAAVVDAMLSVNMALNEWKQEQLKLGWTALAEVPASQINRQSQFTAYYLRAVTSLTKADLMEKYRDYDSTASSFTDKKHMEWLDSAPDVERRNAHWAIANIVQRPHLTIELI